MTDVDAAHQRILSAFGWRQARDNPAGIGNECTHWIYAALLEARAHDHSRALHIAQTGNHYTWGRRIDPATALAGDIVQFRNYQNAFSFWFRDQSTWRSYRAIRGPMHTAMVAITQSHTFDGQHLLMESHLTQPGYARMTIRHNRVYNCDFAVALTSQQRQQLNVNVWPRSVSTSDPEELSRRVAWIGLRNSHAFPMQQADAAFQQLAQHHAPQIDANISVLFRLRTTGEIRFYRPQQSPERLAMNPAQFAEEKRRLIAMMIRSGRPGDPHPLDEYGGDNRRIRVRDHRFDWQFDASAVTR